MQYARNFMKRIGVIMSIIFSLSLGQLCAQFETTAERIQVESLSFRQYNVGGTGTSGMFYYHTFSTESMEGSRWVGAYGGRMRPYVVDNPESKKYMNRFRTMAITKQLCLGVTLPIIGYIAYDSLTEDDVLGWVHQSVDSGSISQSIADDINLQIAPVTLKGMPW